MSYTNSAILARIRNVAARWRVGTCTIERLSQTRGATGAQTQAWVTVASNVPCRLVKVGQTSSITAQIVGQQETITDMYRLSVPQGTALSVDQRVKVGDVYYDVVQLETALTDEVFEQAIIQRQRAYGE